MHPRVGLGLAFLIVAVVQPAIAQGIEPLRSRAAVQAETRALLQARGLTPAASETAPYRMPAYKSQRTREERDAETLTARRQGELKPAGDASEARSEVLELSAASTWTREERKADTRDAAKRGRLTPAGEGPDAPRR